MGATNFTGPIYAGNVLNTTGTTPGTIDNTGSVLLSQSSPITQSATGTATLICIPAGSTIVDVYVGVTTVFSGVAATFTIGTTSSSSNELGGGTGASLGVSAVLPTTQAQTNLWFNVGTTDVVIYVKSTNAGSGVGYLNVQYVQGPNG